MSAPLHHNSEASLLVACPSYGNPVVSRRVQKAIPHTILMQRRRLARLLQLLGFLVLLRALPLALLVALLPSLPPCLHPLLPLHSQTPPSLLSRMACDLCLRLLHPRPPFPQNLNRLQLERNRPFLHHPRANPRATSLLLLLLHHHLLDRLHLQRPHHLRRALLHHH